MKGDKQILEKLNALLADELTAVNQYIVHSEMCENGDTNIFMTQPVKGRSVR